MTFDDFLDSAWSDHGDRPQEVAERLHASLARAESPEQIAALARLATHVFGEHLGEWQRGIDVLEALKRLPAFDGAAAASAAIARGVGTLRVASGDAAALDPLFTEDKICVLAAASSAFAGRSAHGQALASYARALELARAGLPDGSPALRALAVGGNNLAAALEEKPHRDAAETQGMIAAAESGLAYWKRAGTWLEEERAELRLTRSLLCAGQPRAAIASAERCVAVCERSQAPALERFFGLAALAAAQRAAADFTAFEASRERALQCFEQVPADERRWCESELKELGPASR
jgi:hypothetical protein